MAYCVSESVKFLGLNIDGDMFIRGRAAMLIVLIFNITKYGDSDIITFMPNLLKIILPVQKIFRRVHKES